jgi:hypothetical protein
MIETVDSEMLKTVSELTHILRWEDDGGAALEGDHPIPQAAKTNTPRSMDMAEGVFIYQDLRSSRKDTENNRVLRTRLFSVLSYSLRKSYL